MESLSDIIYEENEGHPKIILRKMLLVYGVAGSCGFGCAVATVLDMAKNNPEKLERIYQAVVSTLFP